MEKLLEYIMELLTLQLVSEKEHAAFSKFNDNLNTFKDFPDFGFRDNKE